MARVLIVTDDPAALTFLKRVLTDAAHIVTAVDSGQAALQGLRAAPCDVMVADLATPERKGFELVRGDRDAEPAPRIDVVSGKRPEAVLVIKLAGVHLVQKPFPASEIIGAVNACEHASGARVSVGSLTDYAGRRWARAVVGPILDAEDPRTLAEWAVTIVASVGAVRSWCRTSRISARRSLMFARLLRATVLHERTAMDPQQLLNVADLRTVWKMLRLADPAARPPKLPERVDLFLASQQLVRDSSIIREVEGELRRRLGTATLVVSNQTEARNNQR